MIRHRLAHGLCQLSRKTHSGAASAPDACNSPSSRDGMGTGLIVLNWLLIQSLQSKPNAGVGINIHGGETLVGQL